MADGRTHTLVAAVAGGVGVGVLAALHQPTVPWYAAGAVASLLITPDLDKIKPTISAALAGPLRFPWRLFWLPYGLIPHRHWLSHAPVIGTLGRLLYIALVLTGLNALVQIFLFPHIPWLDALAWQWIKQHPQQTVAAVAPLFINDTLHALWDGWRWQRSQWRR